MKILHDAIVQADGNIVRIAHVLGIKRRHVYRLLYAHRMWPVVNQVRRARARRVEESEWIARTARALSGTENDR